MKKINLLGSGRVGSTLARLWHAQRIFEIQDVLTQSLASATEAVGFIGAGRAVVSLANMRDADLWMLAVPDREISNVAIAVSQLHPSRAPGIAFHCSGALSSSELLPLSQQGWTVASAHCHLFLEHCR